MSKTSVLNWSDKFALIDHYNPTDDAICSTFSITTDELSVAREMRAAGQFGSSASLDAAHYGNPFVASAVPQTAAPVKATRKAATVHVKPTADGQMPETATKRVKVPQKRGRKGDKIQQALLAVPETPTSVEDFRNKHGVSLAVLRQSKRFIGKMEKSVQEQIGEVKVRQDKDTRVLMIWREVAAKA